MMQNTSNGDTNRIWEISGENVRGVGRFHKTLPHNQFGEVDPAAFASLVAATRGDGSCFSEVPRGPRLQHQQAHRGGRVRGVHWRTDNTRSLALGEAIAAEILAHITVDVNEKPRFTFRTFARRADGTPRKVMIESGRIYVDGVERPLPAGSM